MLLASYHLCSWRIFTLFEIKTAECKIFLLAGLQIVQNPSVCFVNLLSIELDVDVRHIAQAMPQGCRDCFDKKRSGLLLLIPCLTPIRKRALCPTLYGYRFPVVNHSVEHLKFSAFILFNSCKALCPSVFGVVTWV